MNTLRSILKLAVVGGAGLTVMELVRRATSKWLEEEPRKTADMFASERSMSRIGVNHRPDESATDALGRIVYEKVTGHEPDQKTKGQLSWAVHIGYGLSVAALFMIVRKHPRVVRDGALYGAGLWLFGDELAVPLLGLSDKPTAYDKNHHAASFAQHIGFGVSTAAATRALGVFR
jgi:uncharacterized membrane protein YagU involved in acid resistance